GAQSRFSRLRRFMASGAQIDGVVLVFLNRASSPVSRNGGWRTPVLIVQEHGQLPYPKGIDLSGRREASTIDQALLGWICAGQRWLCKTLYLRLNHKDVHPPRERTPNTRLMFGSA